jgi:hypothetical protein
VTIPKRQFDKFSVFGSAERVDGLSRDWTSRSRFFTLSEIQSYRLLAILLIIIRLAYEIIRLAIPRAAAVPSKHWRTGYRIFISARPILLGISVSRCSDPPRLHRLFMPDTQNTREELIPVGAGGGGEEEEEEGGGQLAIARARGTRRPASRVSPRSSRQSRETIRLGQLNGCLSA